MDVVIRVEGGSQIGYGHLMRSGALAEELLSREHAVAVTTTTPETAQTVFPDNVEIVTLPSRGDPKPFVNWLTKNSSDIVFTDSYPVDTDYQRAIRNQAPLAVLQDDNRHAVCADVFINSNLYAGDLAYEFVDNEPQLCLGPEYVLLRREIRERVDDDLPFHEQPERALIMMGGSDTAGLTSTIIRAFDDHNLHVDAIVGPGCTDTQEQEVRTAATDCSADVSVACDPTDLVRRMAEADFAVSTASSTTYELLALRTPLVSIPVVDNQVPIAKALRQRDVATVVEPESGKSEIENAIDTYINNSQIRRKRAELGSELVDGQGVSRVVATMCNINNS